jgi:hypothetical protein
MPSDKSTARASDDLETAERKSKTIDERVPEDEKTDVMSELGVPGAIKSDMPGPGEIVLEEEGKAQRLPPVRG